MIGKLSPQIQAYAWGSRTVLAELTGRPAPTPEPEAELWMGAHEAAPSGIAGSTLDKLVADDPVGTMGAAVVERFGGRFPFLLKVLAPERALSIQTHPNAQEALDAPAGTYADAWPKPEALVAVTPYEIFAGLRPYDEAAALLRSLRVAQLTRLVDGAAAQSEPMAALLAAVLRTEGAERARLVDSVVGACRVGDHGPAADAIGAVLRIAEQFPGDIGLVVLPMMVHRVLQPGDYVFVPAGVLHAYVRGTCVEILANSDNIVRAGLTPKQINVEELLRIVDVHRAMVPEQAAGCRVQSFPVDVPHFQLHVVQPDDTPVGLPGHGGPRIALALGGTVRVECPDGTVQLAPGESCFLDASVADAEASGQGTLYLATTGLSG
ncbi:mannose-6-phosphate isomerase, class I [Flexivirga sp. ID2601S]|uniref:mannose-6-phosphate isomerase n=1 Tax=Flexivirga aerilata TaxID=1656889 RepID=A0A849AM04_9MICO|nr:mannose-6-phosphate isomerase, class I [Flexivirga aerilata]NNG37842.1 mannose-6-phosphate isomerase, class I [Flexivirga aerilata]